MCALVLDVSFRNKLWYPAVVMNVATLFLVDMGQVFLNARCFQYSVTSLVFVVSPVPWIGTFSFCVCAQCCVPSSRWYKSTLISRLT